MKHTIGITRGMRKIASIFAMVALFMPLGKAQNEGQYTHFMFNQLSYNPAYAGVSGALSFSVLYNNQWMGLDLQSPLPGLDAGTTPTNYLASIDLPVNFLHGGLGLTFNKESIGYHDNITIAFDYAFRIYWGRGTLAAGVEADLYNFSFNTENLRGITDLGGGGSGSSDPTIGNQEASEFMVDVSTGLYYQVPSEYYIGLSVKNLLASHSAELSYTNPRTLYLIGGYEYAFPFNPSIKLKPSAMVKTVDLSVFQAEAALLLDYETLFWGGLGYRLGEAFTFLAGVNWNFANLNWIRVGVAYDLTTNAFAGFKSGRSNGSLEVFVNGTFRIITPKRPPTSSRTTRFLL